VDLTCFKEEKFILLKNGNSMYEHARCAFEAYDFVPSVSFRLDQLSTSYRLTASGNGLCFVPDTMFRMHLYDDDVVFYNVKGAGGRTLYAANHQNNHSVLIIRKFKETAESVMQKLPSWGKN
jgi:DNA-binding transcriptional LysR family regulator